MDNLKKDTLSLFAKIHSYISAIVLSTLFFMAYNNDQESI